jgi:hypothetical protein
MGVGNPFPCRRHALSGQPAFDRTAGILPAAEVKNARSPWIIAGRIGFPNQFVVKVACPACVLLSNAPFLLPHEHRLPITPDCFPVIRRLSRELPRRYRWRQRLNLVPIVDQPLNDTRPWRTIRPLPEQAPASSSWIRVRLDTLMPATVGHAPSAMPENPEETLAARCRDFLVKPPNTGR